MALLEGKNQTEKNKIIAAAVLGLVALIALYFAFGRSFFSSSTTTATTKSSPTPKPNIAPAGNKPDSALPSASEQDFLYQTTPVVYNAGNANAPDPGRNIFAFFEPPPPTPWRPPPVVISTPTPPPIPTPTPTPVYFVQVVTPGMVFAGAGGFVLVIDGDRFTPDAHVYFNQAEIPTKFGSPKRLTADIPANLIAQEGPKQVIIQNPGGTAYSNPQTVNVQAPPKPTVQYIGMIGRKRFNNDTAYFTDGGRPMPFGARLNDVVGGRFRLIEMSPTEAVFEDTQLGFKHRVPIVKAAGPTGSGQPSRPGFPDGGFPPGFNPGENPPGINGVPRYVPPQPQPGQKPEAKKDVDDDGTGS